jgi:hypothetical protein
MENRKIQNAIDEFNCSSIVKYYNQKGDARAARIAEHSKIGLSESTRKKISDRKKNRKKKTIEQKVNSKKGQEISKLLKENKLGINQIIKQVGCSSEYFYEIKTHLDGGTLKKVDLLNNHPQKGIKIDKEIVNKRKEAQLLSFNFKCPHCDQKCKTEKTLENHIKNTHKKIYSNIQHQKKIFKRDKYMTPIECREWLWKNFWFRGYDDPEYKKYVKNDGELPKGFRTFPWVAPGKTNSRFFNKRLVELDSKIKSISELYSNGNSLRIISKKLNIPTLNE